MNQRHSENLPSEENKAQTSAGLNKSQLRYPSYYVIAAHAELFRV